MKRLELNRKKYGEVKKMDHQKMTDWANDIFEAGFEMGRIDNAKKAAEVYKTEGIAEFLLTLLESNVKGIGAGTKEKLINFAVDNGLIDAEMLKAAIGEE